MAAVKKNYNQHVLINLQIMFRYAWKAFTLELLLRLKKKATAFLDQHQDYNCMSHFCTYSSNTSILTCVYIYYSAQVLEMVTSFNVQIISSFYIKIAHCLTAEQTH